jgi:hypothetical protein
MLQEIWTSGMDQAIRMPWFAGCGHGGFLSIGSLGMLMYDDRPGDQGNHADPHHEARTEQT